MAGVQGKAATSELAALQWWTNLGVPTDTPGTVYPCWALVNMQSTTVPTRRIKDGEATCCLHGKSQSRDNNNLCQRQGHLIASGDEPEDLPGTVFLLLLMGRDGAFPSNNSSYSFGFAQEGKTSCCLCRMWPNVRVRFSFCYPRRWTRPQFRRFFCPGLQKLFNTCGNILWRRQFASSSLFWAVHSFFTLWAITEDWRITTRPMRIFKLHRYYIFQ